MDATERRLTDELLDEAQIPLDERGPKADQYVQATMMYHSRLLRERMRELGREVLHAVRRDSRSP